MTHKVTTSEPSSPAFMYAENMKEIPSPEFFVLPDEDFEITTPIPPRPPMWKNAYADFKKVKSCLMRNIFYEGPRYFNGMETKLGISKEQLLSEIARERIKIINVTMNRMKHPEFPEKLCKVVYQPRAFSWTLETYKVKHPLYTLFKDNPIELENIKEIEKMAVHALTVGYPDLTNGALFYHAVYIDKPKSWKNVKLVIATRWHKYYDKINA